MTKNSIIQKISAGLLCGLLALPAAAQQKPNIVIIYADDLGYGDVSCYGMKRIQTPNIDRLAQQGVKFSNAYATSATCTPSRFGILTGKYPWRQKNTGIAPGDASLILPTDHRTLPGMLKDAGYQTAVIGKWHLGLGARGTTIDWNKPISPGPLETGFTYSFIMPATLDRVPCVFVEDRQVVNADPKDPIEVNYQHKIGNDPTGLENPEQLRMHTDPQQGHNQTIVDSISRIGWMSGGHSARWKDADIAGTITRKAIDFMSRSKQQPFFLYFASGDIHVPRYPHSQFRGKSGMGLRGDAILQLDWTVGQLVKALDSLGLTKNTMIIFSSDNGPVLNDGYLDQAVELVGDHHPAGPFRGGKYSAFEAGARVPFIVKWPAGMKGNRNSDVLIGQLDLFASLAHLTGQTVKPDEAPDSFDMLQQLLGKSKQNRPYLVTHAGTLAIISGDWKYIAPSKGAKVARDVNIELGNDTAPQLYNLTADAHEQQNVAAQYPEKVKTMAAELEAIKEKEQSR
ncbi:sulfatase family protein [Chitinophaga arvensicola]|uniref:Arylsulfatase A n=1 Tax=Chitinophaga arvensicola TaxID=29529 RepID=A0A1I0S7G1_9BACT|nr:arylsulfatase [Chitinophaga arvensicola]SEW51670.1 Arylsulfatase A [Chitinophaga arvensicola]